MVRLMLTKAELVTDGCVPNRNAWTGDGWFYCRGCEAYSFHRAFSHPGRGDVYAVCLVCDQYHGHLPLVNAQVA